MGFLPPTGDGYYIDRSPKRVYDKRAEQWRTNVIYEWDVDGETRAGPSVTAVLGRCPSLSQDYQRDRQTATDGREIAAYCRHRGTLSHYFALDWLANFTADESLEMGDREIKAYEALCSPENLEYTINSLWLARRGRIWGNQLDMDRSDVPCWLQAGYEGDEIIDMGIEREGWTMSCYQQDWMLRDCVEEIRLNAIANFRTAVADNLGGILNLTGIERFVYSSAPGYGGQYDLLLRRVASGGEVTHKPKQNDYFAPPEREFSLHSERVMIDLKFSPIPFIESERCSLRRAMLQLAALAKTPQIEVDRLCVVRCSPLSYPDYEVIWLEDLPWTRKDLTDEFREAASDLREDYRL